MINGFEDFQTSWKGISLEYFNGFNAEYKGPFYLLSKRICEIKENGNYGIANWIEFTGRKKYVKSKVKTMHIELLRRNRKVII